MTDARANSTERLSLVEVAMMLSERRLPPVHTWNPERCGHSDMRIARDGTWFHQGTAIGRPAMVRLFSTILRREPDGRHVLVTPAEKLDIDVDDAAFLATGVDSERDGKDRTLIFQLNTEEYVIAGKGNPIHFAKTEGGEISPYLHVRGGLEALISRPVYYELANAAINEASEPLGLWSDGEFFAFGSPV